MSNAIQVAVAIAFAAFWLYSARRAGRDPQLSDDARKVASFAILFSPWLALAYWLPKFGPNGPFFVGPVEPER